MTQGPANPDSYQTVTNTEHCLVAYNPEHFPVALITRIRFTDGKRTVVCKQLACSEKKMRSSRQHLTCNKYTRLPSFFAVRLTDQPRSESAALHSTHR
jgi:hypothetical protein